MKHSANIRNILVSAISLISLASTSLAEDHKISEWKIGKHLFGPKVASSDFDGKVVVIEHWGVRCPPCIAAMPHLAALDKKHREAGLILIGAESQGSSDAQIKPILDGAKAEYTITQGANGPISFRGIPHAFVFNRSGELVYQGHPGNPDFDKSIKSALKENSSSSSSFSSTKSTILIPKRKWTNKEGKVITASVKAVNSTTATFILNNGTVAEYALDKLSDDSRSVIEAAAK